MPSRFFASVDEGYEGIRKEVEFELTKVMSTQAELMRSKLSYQRKHSNYWTPCRSKIRSKKDRVWEDEGRDDWLSNLIEV
jgi:hypothetical protein